MQWTFKHSAVSSKWVLILNTAMPPQARQGPGTKLLHTRAQLEIGAQNYLLSSLCVSANKSTALRIFQEPQGDGGPPTHIPPNDKDMTQRQGEKIHLPLLQVPACHPRKRTAWQVLVFVIICFKDIKHFFQEACKSRFWISFPSETKLDLVSIKATENRLLMRLVRVVITSRWEI